MKTYESKDIRNVGVVGHGDSGKTTLTAGLLFTAGATNRLLRVDEGNTITDFDDEEIQRKITISTAIAVAEWKKHDGVGIELGHGCAHHSLASDAGAVGDDQDGVGAWGAMVHGRRIHQSI